jgi:hypothetical protein
MVEGFQKSYNERTMKRKLKKGFISVTKEKNPQKTANKKASF